MFQSFVTKFRPGANDFSRSSGSKIDVHAEPHPGHHRVAQRIGAEPRDHVEWVDAVA